MGLFRSKEEKEAAKVARLTTLFSKQHQFTIKDTITSFFEFTNLREELDKNHGVLDGLYVWHDALVVASQTSIKSKVQEELAADLLWAYGQALCGSGDVAMPFSEYTKSISDASSVYLDAYRRIQDNGMAIPSLRLARSIKQLESLDIPMEAAITQLPAVETYVLTCYKDFWTKNL